MGAAWRVHCLRVEEYHLSGRLQRSALSCFLYVGYTELKRKLKRFNNWKIYGGLEGCHNVIQHLKVNFAIMRVVKFTLKLRPHAQSVAASNWVQG